MRWILYNDDFGETYGLTDAVKESFLNGTTTCAGIRTNGYAFEYSVQEVLPSIPGLELGLHLDLTEGPPEAELSKIPHLVDKSGAFKMAFQDYFFSIPGNANLLREIYYELEAQFEKAAKYGLKINHVNGNNHIHIIPGVFKITCQLMKEYGMQFVRVPLEPFYFHLCLNDSFHMLKHLNPIKHLLLKQLSYKSLPVLNRFGLSCIGSFIGILYTGRMTPAILECALKKLKKTGVDITEVLFHPAYIDYEIDQKEKGLRVPGYYYSEDRLVEKENLLSRKMKDLLDRHSIQPVTHESLM